MVWGNSKVEIDLSQLESNFNLIKEKANGAKVNCIIKADAYGHGAVEIARFLEDKADLFSVANINEVVELRKGKINKDILCLGYIDKDQYKLIEDNSVILTIFNLEQAKEINSYLKERNIKRDIYIKINTGMNRIGFAPNENSKEEIISISRMESFKIKGVYSHFACADEEDLSYTDLQYDRFSGFCDELEKEIDIGIRHITNSAGLLTGRYNEDMVRAGIILYGMNPLQKDFEEFKSFKPIMKFFTRITNISNLDKDDRVGYGRNWRAKENSKIGSIGIGYADGYLRFFSNKSKVIVNGKAYPIIGNICMDQGMVDITNSNGINIGDKVHLYDDEYPDTKISHLANMIDTIPYELTCAISRRVERVYIIDGKEIKNVNYLD